MGERELHTPGPGEVLSHGRGASRHICSPLTLEKQQRDGHRNRNGRALPRPRHGADAAIQRVFNEGAPPRAYVKPRIKDLVDP